VFVSHEVLKKERMLIVETLEQHARPLGVARSCTFGRTDEFREDQRRS
jgi:hypothetical protein